MNWYSLAAVKNHYLSHKFLGNSRETVKQLFSNIFHIIEFEELFEQENKIIINEFSLNKIHNMFKYYVHKQTYESELNPTMLITEAKKIKTRDNEELLNEYTANFVRNLTNKGFETIYQKSKKMKRHISNLEKLYSVNKVIAIDFEYRNNSKYDISEIGITIFNPQDNLKRSKHIIIKDDITNKSKKKRFLENQFNFGISESLYIDEALKLLSNLMKEADFIIGHDIANEFRILDISPNWDYIIDTKFLDMLINDRHIYKSLEGVLTEYGFKPQFLHNSGNDARFTMDLVQVMYREMGFNILELKRAS